MKRALIVGINYVGTGYDLRGCINDAYNMEKLIKSYDFNEVELLLEAQATTEGIKAGLQRLVKGAMPGDVLVFHYSGHGSQVPNQYEEDGYDEIICPYDLDWSKNYITDNYLRSVFDSVPNGVNVTVVLDSCHSGTSLDQRSLFTSRYISTSGTRDIAPELTARYIPPPAPVQAQIDALAKGEFESLRDVDVSALLIATSKDSQLSADAKIDGMYQGAGTYSLIQGLTENKTSSYKDLVAYMNKYMDTHGYDQDPQLNGPTNLYGQKVFEPWDLMLPVDVVTSPPYTPPITPETGGGVIIPSPVPKDDGDDVGKYVMIGFIVLMILVFVFKVF